MLIKGGIEMENGYTFDELKRERLSGIINGLILELAWQDKIVFYKLPDKKNTIRSSWKRRCINK